jgi:hypothetical protein
VQQAWSARQSVAAVVVVVDGIAQAASTAFEQYQLLHPYKQCSSPLVQDQRAESNLYK